MITRRNALKAIGVGLAGYITKPTYSNEPEQLRPVQTPSQRSPIQKSNYPSQPIPSLKPLTGKNLEKKEPKFDNIIEGNEVQVYDTRRELQGLYQINVTEKERELFGGKTTKYAYLYDPRDKEVDLLEKLVLEASIPKGNTIKKTIYDRTKINEDPFAKAELPKANKTANHYFKIALNTPNQPKNNTSQKQRQPVKPWSYFSRKVKDIWPETKDMNSRPRFNQ
ncbi:hypothetical protein CMI38_01900 [Candidatus Pacearchaeota archaeon]|nr:hypothetical protein [Candidatus Pacearchaeota archaeon]